MWADFHRASRPNSPKSEGNAQELIYLRHANAIFTRALQTRTLCSICDDSRNSNIKIEISFWRLEFAVEKKTSVSLHSKNAMASANFQFFHVALQKINSLMPFIQICELQLRMKREKRRRTSMTCHASSQSLSFSCYFHRRRQNFRASKIIFANSNLFSMFFPSVGEENKLFRLKTVHGRRRRRRRETNLDY